MKLITKFFITTGVLLSTTAGIVSYGVYSYTKFNDKFQGKGWYYKGIKFSTKKDALDAKKQDIKTVHKDIISIQIGSGAEIEFLGGSGIIQEPGKINLTALTFKPFVGDQSIQIYGDSEIGKKLIAETDKTNSKNNAKIIFGTVDHPTEIYKNFGAVYVSDRIINGKHSAKIRITNTMIKTVFMESINPVAYDPISGPSVLKTTILDDPKFLEWLLGGAVNVAFSIRSIDYDDLLLVNDDGIKHVI